jgi:hypothetical protein
MLTYMLYTKLMNSKTGYRFNMSTYILLRGAGECWPTCCIQNLWPVRQGIDSTCLHRYDLQEQENVDLHVVYKTYDQ